LAIQDDEKMKMEKKLEKEAGIRAAGRMGMMGMMS